MWADEPTRFAGVMAMLAIASVGCHWPGRQAAPVGTAHPVPLAGRVTAVDGFKSRSGVRVTCPAEASSNGPVPVAVEIAANRRTYWDTNSIIDEALSVVFVRSDRPGMVAIAKIPPNAYMLPNTPLGDRPSDKELDDPSVRIVEKMDYDLLAYGRTHVGAADYFVIAAFSDAWQGPTRVRITSPAGPKSVDGSDLGPKNASLGYDPAPSRRGVFARLAWVDGRVAVVGSFRVAAGADPIIPAPFLSVVIARLQTTGGIVAGQMWVPWARDQDEWIGNFKVPVQDLRLARGKELDRGNYALFAFVGTEVAPVQVFKVE